MFLLRILTIAFLLIVPIFGRISVALAEDSTSQETSSVEAQSVTPEPASSSSEDLDNQPLDNWAEIPPESSSQEETHSEQKPATVYKEGEDPVPSPTQIGVYPVVGATRAILKKTQNARLKKVEKKLRVIVSQEQETLNKEAKKDPRGQSEVRICSVNFNSFGTKEENERLLKKIPKPRLAKAERSILKAIAETGCEIVAVQGIIGRSPSFAIEALTGFVKKLSKKTEKAPWKFEVARSKDQNGYQAFLIKDAQSSPIVGFKVETFPNLIMKVPGRLLRSIAKLKKELVPRDFLKLTVEVKSQDLVNPDPLLLESKVSTKGSRKLVIINGILAAGVAPFVEEPRLLKLQIADVAVRLFEAEQSRITPDEQPIVLATIERVEGIMGGAQQILSGRINIDDFEEDGACKIISTDLPVAKEEGVEVAEEEEGEEEVKKEVRQHEDPKIRKKVDFTIDTVIECPAPMDRPQPRFDILASVPFEKRESLGITDGLVRVSVGIEDVEDILEDLDQALS